MIDYVGVDTECVALCRAMNEMLGIQTIESCCGHNKHPYHIWFVADDLEALPRLLYYFDNCHCGFHDWRIVARTDCAMSPVVFLVEGPIGAYKESEHIAELLKEEMIRVKA